MLNLRGLRHFLVFVLVCQILFPVPLFADAIGKFTELRGDVTLKRAQQSIKPKVDENVQTKDLVATGAKSRAKLLLADESMLSVGQNSNLEITEFLLDRGKRSSVLSLTAGTAYTKVEKFLSPDTKFEVRTPTAVAGVRGTEWITVVESNPGTTFYALANAISVLNPQFPAQVVVLQPGQFTVVALGAAPTAPAAFTMAMIQGFLSDLGVTYIPAAGAAGAEAGALTTTGIGAGTVTAGVVGVAAVAAGLAAASGSSGDTTPAHISTTHHCGY